MKSASVPVVTEKDLETLPEGLYRLGKVRRMRHGMRRVRMALFVRLRPDLRHQGIGVRDAALGDAGIGQPVLAKCVDGLEIRPDGMLVIRQWSELQ